MGFDLPSQMDIDPIYPISIQTNHSEHLPLWSHVKAREEMTELGFKFHSCQNCLTVRGLCMAFAGIENNSGEKGLALEFSAVPALWGEPRCSRQIFSLISGKEKAKKENTFARIASLFEIEKDDLSLGPHLVCRKCLRKVDRFERTLKKLNELEKVYRKNLDQWKTDAESERSKRCSSSPGYGIKKSRPLQPCAPVTSVRRSLNVESVSQPQSCKELEKENMELSINPGNV